MLIKYAAVEMKSGRAIYSIVYSHIDPQWSIFINLYQPKIFARFLILGTLWIFGNWLIVRPGLWQKTFSYIKYTPFEYSLIQVLYKSVSEHSLYPEAAHLL